MLIGLCGAHRTGKTTLAHELVNTHAMYFSQTQVTKIFEENGLDPKDQLSFGKRLWIQNIILDESEKTWKSTDKLSITDRTPLDMLAYTLTDIDKNNTFQLDIDKLQEYTNRCFEVTNRLFSSLFIIQPGIPLKYEKGKAILNTSYIELLNTVMIGLLNDERLQVPSFMVPRITVSYKDRVDFILNNI